MCTVVPYGNHIEVIPALNGFDHVTCLVQSCTLTDAIDWDIFVVKKLSPITFNNENQATEMVSLTKNRVTLFHQVVIAMKVKPHSI